MANSPKVKEAIRATHEKLMNMPEEEFKKLWEEFDKNYVRDPVFEKWIAEAIRGPDGEV